MNATELIQQLKALPATEQADFERLFRQMREESSAGPPGSGQGAPIPPWPDFTLRLQRIYGDRVLADSESVISYGRGQRSTSKRRVRRGLKTGSNSRSLRR